MTINRQVHATPLLTVLMLVALHHCAGQPDWVSGFGKDPRYPESAYLTGFGIAQCNGAREQAECSEKASSTARRNLVEKVRISLQNTVVSHKEEINQTVSQYFSATTNAVSGLEIEGLGSESYDDVAKKVCYALAYVRRDILVESYSRKVEGLRATLKERLKAGMKYDSLDDRERALKTLSSCYLPLRELEQSESILFAVASESAEALARLKAGSERDRLTSQSVEEAVADLLKKSVKNLEDAAYLIAFLLKEQVSQEVGTVRVEPFTYRDTRAASSFSRYFQQVFEGKLSSVSGWKVEAEDESIRSTPTNACTVGGTYWEQDEGLKVLVSLYRGDRDEVIAGANTFIPKAVVQKFGFRAKPENVELVLADQKQYFKQDISPIGLNLEIWTNKGATNPLYSKGERMNVFVRLNMPAYVRFVYHLADGRRALLLDNYYLGDREVNHPHQIPQEFVCEAPYGVEVLQVFARAVPFDSVPTKKVGGYEILTGDLGKFLAVTRGMKTVSLPVMQAERRVVLTTVDK